MDRLIRIQEKLRAPKDKKSQGEKNVFKYRSAEDILEAAKPILKETATAVVLSDEIVQIGQRYFLHATAALKAKGGLEPNIASASGWAELDSHEVSNQYGTKKTMSNEQATGCASSYARKYALCGLFAIDNDENDPDRTEITPAPKQQSKPAPEPPEPQPQPTFDDNYYSLCADLDAAESVQQCRATATMAIGQTYEHLIRKKACSRGMQVATSLDELKLAYSIVTEPKDKEEAKNEYVRIATEKGWAK